MDGFDFEWSANYGDAANLATNLRNLKANNQAVESLRQQGKAISDGIEQHREAAEKLANKTDKLIAMQKKQLAEQQREMERQRKVERLREEEKQFLKEEKAIKKSLRKNMVDVMSLLDEIDHALEG